MEENESTPVIGIPRLARFDNKESESTDSVESPGIDYVTLLEELEFR